jgi:hypothetical protein
MAINSTNSTNSSKTMHGTRAILEFIGSDDVPRVLGMFESIETGVTQDHFEPFVLGRASAGEIVLTGQAPIMVRLSGFRKVDTEEKGPTGDKYGPYGTANVNMNTLTEIVTGAHEFAIQVHDRQTGKMVLQVKNAKVVSHNLSIAAKAPARMTIELVGMSFDDATTNNANTEGGVEY